MRLSHVLSGPILLLLAACGGAEPTTTDAGPPPSDGGHVEVTPDASVDPCANGLFDDGEADVDCGGVCARRCGAGAVCAEHDDCESDAYCKFTTGIGHRCVDTFSSCAGAACHEEEYCRLVRMPDRRQRVECAPRVRPGRMCRGNFIGYDDIDPCVDGYACVGICAVGPTEEGASCSAIGKAGCGPGLHCDQRFLGDPLLCVRDKSAGQRCLNQWECESGLTCADDRCTPRALEGESCIVEAALSSQHCDLGLECRTPPGACRSDRDCPSGRCCAGGTGPVCTPAGEACEAPRGTCGPLSD